MTDSEIISHYGGPTKFAQLLGLSAPGSVQRVANWGVRGIPADIKLRYPHFFGITIGAVNAAPELASPQQAVQAEGQGV